jgi:hypothetical protein
MAAVRGAWAERTRKARLAPSSELIPTDTTDAIRAK